MSAAALAGELRALLGEDSVVEPVPGRYLADATEAQGLRGEADAVVLPRDTESVAQAMERCYSLGVPITPRGGGTGYAGGAVPGGGVVLALERMRGVRSIEPLGWRAEVEAGLTTAHVQRLALESGLYFPPDPGAAEQSQIGGNVATNAGGPHAFKYGVTAAWVTGLEAVVPPGRVVRLGGAARKDVAGYDLRSLLVGSEGTLGVITAVKLRLIPRPQTRFPVLGFYRDARAGTAAVEAALGSGVVPAALEFVDAGADEAALASFPAERPAGPSFVVLAEADGSEPEAEEGRAALREALSAGAVSVVAPREPSEVSDLWRWRDGISLAAVAALGGKLSEDVAVPVERLMDAIEGTVEIGARHGLRACSWGHAGDGNLHSTFLFDRRDADARGRAGEAAAEVFDMALKLGGTVSGEHGVGIAKAGQLARQLDPAAAGLHGAIKDVFDPEGLLNPRKKSI